ncbi:MAG: hypothetical protein ACOCQP_01790 [Lentisphaeria bacterium]
MITILLGIIAAGLGYLAGDFFLESYVWGLTFAVAGFAIINIPLNLLIKRRLQKLFTGIQSQIQQQQNQIQQRMNQLQNQGGGSAKGMQKQMEKKQTQAIKDALAQLEDSGHLAKWNFLAGKQLDTLKGQLAFQIQNFEQADKYLDNAMNSDPMTVGMKMVRAYKHADWDKLRKLYKKGRRRFKDENSILIYALYSWILVKENMIDEAIEVLVKGKDDTESEVLANNWNYLVNGQVRKFSNAGLGDNWYALQLERPKAGKTRQRKSARRR